MARLSLKEMKQKVWEYAVINWKSTVASPESEEMEDLIDADHIGYTLELLEEDTLNEERANEAEEIIDVVKALRVYGSIGLKIADYFNEGGRYFSDWEIMEFAHDYNTDYDTLKTMLDQLAEQIDDMRQSGYYDDEAIALYNEGKEHLKTLATA